MAVVAGRWVGKMTSTAQVVGVIGDAKRKNRLVFLGKVVEVDYSTWSPEVLV